MICDYCSADSECIEFVNTHGYKKNICNTCKNANGINIASCDKCDIRYEYNCSKNGYDTGYNSLCHKCYLEEFLDSSEDYNQLAWGYRPDQIFFGSKMNSGKLFMGIELETDEGDDDRVCEIKEFLKNPYGMFWGKEDGSLSSCGVEFVSHPATLAFHKKTIQWKKLLKKISDVGLKSNDCSNCGIHIHMNRTYLTNEQIQKLDALVNLYSTTFRRFARRNSRDYAIYNPNKTERNLGRNNNHNSRYSCLNFHNDNTVEWRIFKGNTKYESIMALFELIQGTCDFVKQNDITLEILYGDKNSCLIKFKKFLEEQNFDYLPRYTEMCRVWRDLVEE